MSEEKVFFDSKGVKVTSSRLLTFGTTTSMRGITSVSKFIHKPSRKGPIILFVVGLILFAWQWYIGLAVVALAVVWWFSQKPEFSIRLATASGESEALADKDEQFIDDVVNALNDSIVHRG
jgi:hypothetical protein